MVNKLKSTSWGASEAPQGINSPRLREGWRGYDIWRCFWPWCLLGYGWPGLLEGNLSGMAGIVHNRYYWDMWYACYFFIIPYSMRWEGKGLGFRNIFDAQLTSDSRHLISNYFKTKFVFFCFSLQAQAFSLPCPQGMQVGIQDRIWQYGYHLVES